MESHESGFPLHWWQISWSVGKEESNVCEGGIVYEKMCTKDVYKRLILRLVVKIEGATSAIQHTLAQ